MLTVRDFVRDVIPLDGLRPRSAPRKDSMLDHDQNPGRKKAPPSNIVACELRGHRGDQASLSLRLDFNLYAIEMILHNFQEVLAQAF